jgi:hypothetical protein
MKKIGSATVVNIMFALVLVAFVILAIHYSSVVAERNDYLLLIKAYGLGGGP